MVRVAASEKYPAGAGGGAGRRVLSPVAQLLKERTAQTHARVEAILALTDPDLSRPRMLAVLERFFGFWQGNERLIDEWATREPDLARSVRWLRRRRGEVLRHDLLRMGRTLRDLAELPEAPAVFTTPDTADTLGWLYVSEGATLGGAVLDRTMPEALRARTFAPYVEGPGPMWRAYLDLITEWVGDDATRRDRVVGAGMATFAALERWLVPLARDEAA
jgi:heme oxygenase (biliverdin-IX-beta and delta-forming)